jgi:D-aminoacyl-tRNA deacylase
MIALIQRVNYAKVVIEGQLYSEIHKGILALVGVEKNDTSSSADKLLEKILAYRIFADSEGKMNLSLRDIDADFMLVSQFTLAATTDKGLRPGFSSAMPPKEAEEMFDYLVSTAKEKYPNVSCGQFAADMQIALENNGPVTFSLKA